MTYSPTPDAFEPYVASSWPAITAPPRASRLPGLPAPNPGAKRCSNPVLALPKGGLILEVVARFYEITVADLKSPCRKRSFAWPRQMAAFMIREMTDMSYPQIGRILGDRHHTSILFAWRKLVRQQSASTPVASKMRADLRDLRIILFMTICDMERQRMRREMRAKPTNITHAQQVAATTRASLRGETIPSLPRNHPQPSSRVRQTVFVD